MRRITLTSAAFALLVILLGGVAVAGAAPQAKPEDTKVKMLRFDVQFSDFHLVDVGEPGLSLGDYPVFHDLLSSRGKQVGDQGGTCPVVDVSQGLIHCSGDHPALGWADHLPGADHHRGDQAVRRHRRHRQLPGRQWPGDAGGVRQRHRQPHPEAAPLGALVLP